MPGFAFPEVGPVGLGSPPFRSTPMGAPSVLCSAKTAVAPSRVASQYARFPVPCCFLVRSRPGESIPAAPSPLICRWTTFPAFHKENDGSPKFPSYPCEYMPCAQTPVVSLALANTLQELLPSAPRHIVGFHHVRRRGYPIGPLCRLFRGSITQPAFSLHPASHPLLPRRMRVRYRPAG